MLGGSRIPKPIHELVSHCLPFYVMTTPLAPYLVVMVMHSLEGGTIQ